MTLLALLHAAWAWSLPTSAQPALPTVTLGLGRHTVVAEVADDPTERSTGLMFREALPEGRGMLFVYPTARERGFWMKNTSLALTIGWIAADGTLVGTSELTPRSEASVPSPGSVLYALEVPSGWFERHGVPVGTRVTGLPGPSPH